MIDYIRKDEFSLKYDSRKSDFLHPGAGTRLLSFKIDIENTFRLIPVAPSQ